MTCAVAATEFSRSVHRSIHWRENKFYWTVNFTGYFPYHLFACRKLMCFQQMSVKSSNNATYRILTCAGFTHISVCVHTGLYWEYALAILRSDS